MSDSFKALCSDFYVNQKLCVKMDLPRSRETVLDMFERVRRQFPHMGLFRRYREELALESAQSDTPHRWLAVRTNNIRSGVVDPVSLEEGYSLHKHVLEVAPYFLNISALDIDYIELLFGFDLAAPGNHDAIVAEALLAGSPLAAALDVPGTNIIDCQPIAGFAYGQRGELEIHFEIKTRSTSANPQNADSIEPISVYLTLRRFGAVPDLKDLAMVFTQLCARGEELVESRVVPTLLTRLRDVISSGSA